VASVTVRFCWLSVSWCGSQSS